MAKCQCGPAGSGCEIDCGERECNCVYDYASQQCSAGCEGDDIREIPHRLALQSQVDFCAHNTPLVNIASHLSRIAKAKIQVPSSNIENRVSRKLEGAPLSEVLQSLGLTPKEPEPLDPRLVQWLKDLLQHVDPPQWTVSRNGQFKGVATEGECRVRSEGTFWARFEFAIDGSSHTIEGERPFDGAPSLVTFDGASCPGGLLGLATKVGGFPPNARLEVTFELPPSSGRYRFDAEPNLVIE